MSRIDPGEGYRLLEEGEVIQEGDEYRVRDELWNRSPFWGGTFISSVYWPHRRKLPPFPVEFAQQVADIMADKPAESGWVLTADRKPTADDADERRCVYYTTTSGTVATCHIDRFLHPPHHCDKHISTTAWHPKPKAEKPAPYVPPKPEQRRWWHFDGAPLAPYTSGLGHKPNAVVHEGRSTSGGIDVCEYRVGDVDPDAAIAAREYCKQHIARIGGTIGIACKDILNILNEKPE